MRKLQNEELERLTIEEYKSSDKTPFIIVLDNIRSLNNIGSVFRTSDAFLLEGVYLCGITAKPPHREIQKTALGATESVNWKYFKTTADAIISLRNKDYTILAIEQVENSCSLEDFQLERNNKYAIILGHEVKGVSQEIVNLSDKCLEITQLGTKHSINISVCAGIVIWDLFNKYKCLV